AEMLFQLLDSSENTEGLSDVMRYILYRYNGKDYGVTSFTFSPYDLEGIPLGTTIIGGNIQDKVWFTLIGKGYSPEDAIKEVKMVVEGFYTTKSAYLLAKRSGVEMPIVEEAHKILFEGKPARDAVLNLMQRDKKHETEKSLL
ncbi:MAG: hypothetical protein IKB60_06730, partial [Clostridia bacterium]|nr:hypothetical protein [Clostridia bacterium]